MHKDKRVEKKKTVTIKRCLNPVFNESFPFDIPAHVLRETTIIITVMDKDRLSRNDVIGKVETHIHYKQIASLKNVLVITFIIPLTNCHWHINLCYIKKKVLLALVSQVLCSNMPSHRIKDTEEGDIS